MKSVTSYLLVPKGEYIMIASRLSGEPGNLGEEIVMALKRYGSVPVEFLSRLTGRDTSTIEKYLTTLEQKRVVTREDQNVRLDVQEDQKAQAG